MKRFISTVAKYTDFRLILLFFIVMISRISFLDHGYGLDPDAYRITAAGQHLSDTGQFICRRPPCHPIPVLSYAALTPTTSLFFNTITALLSALASVAFTMSLRTIGIKSAVLAGVAFAAVPIVYINSTNSMDYIWALSFAIFSLSAATSGRHILSGLFLGISAGCRLEYLAILIPIVVLLAFINEGKQRIYAILKILLSSTVSTLCAFAPVLYNFGTKIITSKFKITLDISSTKLIGQATFDVFSGLGMLALVAMAVFTLYLIIFSSETRRSWILSSRIRKGWMLMCLVAIIIYVWGYLRAPYESGYLISFVPFVIGFFVVILDVNTVGQKVTTVSLGLVLLSPFFLNTSLTEDPKSLDYRIVLSSAPHRSINFEIAGPVFSISKKREAVKRRYDTTMRNIIALGRKNKNNVAVIAGAMHPRLQAEWSSEIGTHVELVELVKTKHHMEALKARNSKIYYLPGVDRYNRSSFKINLRAHGARLLR